jgi:UDP:flavonoid glycosyltransferase YjiC (YdhE family)
VRALFTCNPELGHFLPLLPFASALIEARHEVAFVTPACFRDAVESVGFRWIKGGIEDDDPEMVALQAARQALHGPERDRFVLERVFAGARAQHMVTGLRAVAARWQPDLLVRDSHEFGAMVVSELLGIPHAKIEVLATNSARSRHSEMLLEPLQRLRAAFRLPPQPISRLMEQYLVLSSFPASLAGGGSPVTPTTHRIRPSSVDGPDATLPAWVNDLGSRPLIYVSLGTIFNGARGREMFPKLLAGLSNIDAEVVLTVGHELDPESFGPQPAQIHLERFLSLGALLPHCSLVVFHGGSGTLIQVLAHGLPMVILPLGADQPDNATRCAQLGASRTLDQNQLSREQVSETVLDVLHSPSYHQSARRLRDELNSLPDLPFAVELLERLARDKAPIIAEA